MPSIDSNCPITPPIGLAAAMFIAVTGLTWPTDAVAGAKGRPNVNMPSAPASTAAPPVRNQQWLGPRNFYFERGTGQTAAPVVVIHGRRAMPPLEVDKRFHRRPGRAGFREGAGSVGSPERLSSAQVRSLQSRMPTRRQGRHIVDVANPWAARDSAGVQFGLPATRVPAVLSTADQASRVLHGRINDRNKAFSALHYEGPQLGLVVRRSFRHHQGGAHRGRQYLVADGVWYRPWNGRFRVVLPPIGLVLTGLPDGFDPVLLDGVEYFASNGVRLRQVRDGYVVVNVPADLTVYE